jgi:phenylpropionate dioxygenase-like ring-hydroxylating dioxygenase large terminal subunit
METKTRTTSLFNEALLDGMPNSWNAILPSDELKEKPVGVRRLGKDIVLWRDGSGKAHAFPDFCPHRGSALSQGDVVDGNLACWYHGIQFDGEGVCREVPAAIDSALVGKMEIQKYRLEERCGMLWAYLFDEERSPAPPLILAEEMADPEWTWFIARARWNVNWLYIADNLSDPMHGPFLHAKSYTLRFGAKGDTMRVVNFDNGFRVEREKQKGVNFDWSEYRNTGTHWWRLDIPYPWSAGPGGPMRVVSFTTPVDRNCTQAYFFRGRKVSGWRRWYWRTLYQWWLEAKHWTVLEQDREALEAIEAEARHHERLCESDVGLIQLRRLLTKEIRRHSGENGIPQ